MYFVPGVYECYNHGTAHMNTGTWKEGNGNCHWWICETLCNKYSILKYVIIHDPKVKLTFSTTYTEIRCRFFRYLCNFIKIIWNEILRAQCTNHNAVILMCNTYVGIPVNMREYYR